MLDLSIQLIRYSDGVQLRSAVLRPDVAKIAAGLAYYEDDGAVHFGAYLKGTLIAVATFTPFAESGERDLESYQLRGAATHSNFQGQGVGQTMIGAGIGECFRRGASSIWCDGRSSAKTFYERLGFTPVGEEFQTASGLHYRFRRLRCEAT